jgi:hypothetical protein
MIILGPCPYFCMCPFSFKNFQACTITVILVSHFVGHNIHRATILILIECWFPGGRKTVSIYIFHNSMITP